MENSKGLSPVSDSNARVLVLGSLPGQKSLLEQQYYAHAQNAFWPIMRHLYDINGSYDDRCCGLIRNKIALWDVLSESLRPGSMDANIRVDTAVANNFVSFLRAHPAVTLIAFNGKKAQQLFQRLVRLPTEHAVRHVGLPSTSPAYASLSVSGKLAAWRTGLS